MKLTTFSLLLGFALAVQSAHATLIVTWEGTCDSSCASASGVLRISEDNPKGDAKLNRRFRAFFEGFDLEITQHNGDIVSYSFDRISSYRRILGAPSAGFFGDDGIAFSASGPVYALAWNVETPAGRFSGPDSEFCTQGGVCRVPEGGSLGIAGLALAGIAYLRRRRNCIEADN